jgi:mitochondrial import inner membrane translocase subunit TIM50
MFYSFAAPHRRLIVGSSTPQLFLECSEAPGAGKAGCKPTPLSEETSIGHRLFENVRKPGEAAGATATEIPATATAEPLQRSAAGRVLGTLGNALFFGTVGAGIFIGYHHYAYDPRDLQQQVEDVKRAENPLPTSKLWATLIGYYLEQRQKLEQEVKKYAEPPSDRLLPDLPPHARGVKTLVLDLDNVLVHSDWTRERGWRTFKRPGADEFIRDLAQYYELVVYSSQLPTYVDPILERLDPQRIIQYRLYRDSTLYVNGKHVRDLSKINRDLSQVLMITADPQAYALQPDNAIKLPEWKTNEINDTTLLDLLPFLEAVVRTHVPDVRDVVRSYEGQHIPTAFRERMARVQEAKTKRQRGFLSGGTSR